MRTLTIIIGIFSTLLLNAQTNVIMGTASGGGANGTGTIFYYNLSDNSTTTLTSFGQSIDGRVPEGGLIQSSNGKFYGITAYGGSSDFGVFYEYDFGANQISKLFEFEGDTGTYLGKRPRGKLTEASNGIIYGLTSEGGQNDKGVFFQYVPSTNTYTEILSFDSTTYGESPQQDLVESNNALYMTASGGGANGDGVILKYDLSNSNISVVHNFNSNNQTGSNPFGGIMLANNGNLYGNTWGGGPNIGGVTGGVIYEYNISSDSFRVLTTTHGIGTPRSALIEANNGKLYGTTCGGGNNYDGTIYEYDLTLDSLRIIHHFDIDSSGACSELNLLNASDGYLYGATTFGGSNSDGTLFRYDLSSSNLTTIHHFDFNTSGHWPKGDLLETTLLISNLSEVEVGDGPQIFPNPTQDQLNIELKDNSFNRAEVISIDGRSRIYDLPLSQQQQINLSELQSGLYILRIWREGELLATKKFSKL
jgi:uncharacterized repeat protein (TIGR03803 family)